MDTCLTIALPKGRLADATIQLLLKAGVKCAPLLEPTRKLVLTDADSKYSFIFVKPGDVPTYIEHGVADLGVAGKDTLLEERKDIYELLDLKFGLCRMCVAGFKKNAKKPAAGEFKIASKYVNVASDYCLKKGINAEIIKLNGSVELAPVIGLSDVIVDIVESGKTLEANGLEILEEICRISARLVVNKTSLKTKADVIMPLIDSLKSAL